MKKIILNIAILASFAVFFTACEKEETKVVFDETKAVLPVLKMSLTSVKLEDSQKDAEAISFDITKADYGVPTAVAYSIVIRMPDAANGDKNEKVISVPVGSLSKKMTGKELNNVFINDFYKDNGSTNKASVQVIANFSGTIPLKSKIEELTVVTF